MYECNGCIFCIGEGEESECFLDKPIHKNGKCLCFYDRVDAINEIREQKENDIQNIVSKAEQ